MRVICVCLTSKNDGARSWRGVAWVPLLNGEHHKSMFSARSIAGTDARATGPETGYQNTNGARPFSKHRPATNLSSRLRKPIAFPPQYFLQISINH